MPNPSASQPRLIRLPDVIRRTSKSRSAIYAAMSRGKFPRQVKLGPGAAAWVESEIDQWVADIIASREGSQAA